MFQYTQNQIDVLNSLESSAKFTAFRDNVKDENGKLVLDGDNNPQSYTITKCELIHLITGKMWHDDQAEAPGQDGRRLALDKALATVNPGLKPRSGAEILAENVQLKKMVAELTGKDPTDVVVDITDVPVADSEATTTTGPIAPAGDPGIYATMSDAELRGVVIGRGMQPLEQGSMDDDDWRTLTINQILSRENLPKEDSAG